MNFKDNLKRIREEQGLTQQNLSDKLNIPLSTERNWEQGLRQPRNLEILEQLTKILDCDYNDLLK